MQKGGDKRGQVTIFIIIAIVIISIVALVYFLIPRTQTETTFDAQNPQGFIQNCLEDKLQNVISTVSSQGGSMDPQFYFTYQGNNIEYLCYTTEYYTTCIVQQPLLKQHVESEIKDAIAEEVEGCFVRLQENYEADGYVPNLQRGRTDVELLPKRVIVTFADYILTVNKGETSRYDGFNAILDNNLYEMTSIANSIIEWESTYGNAETTTYMSYYKDLKVEKHGQQDGTKIYIITDRNTDNKFQFASRSGVFPPGYGTAGVAA